MIEVLAKEEKISLPINGREMTFSKEELVSIVEEHFNRKAKEEKVSQTTERKEVKVVAGSMAYEVAQKPTDGKCFNVNPTEIDENLFLEKRKGRQEETRQLILEAIAEMKNNPAKYARSFKILIPEKTWSVEKAEELENLASNLGDHMTDWVEQALEWAQRISNGETWKAVCDDRDTIKWFRLIKWKDGKLRLVGGASEMPRSIPASHVCDFDCRSYYRLKAAVPSVVRYV